MSDDQRNGRSGSQDRPRRDPIPPRRDPHPPTPRPNDERMQRPKPWPNPPQGIGRKKE